MEYILDESALAYMLEVFPRNAVPELFDRFSDRCEDGCVICEKETKKSMNSVLEEEFSYDWIKEHNKMFRTITQKEASILGELVDEGLFENIRNSKDFVRNIPIAIPFIFSIAINENRTIVMSKKSKNYYYTKEICGKKGIVLLDVDGFLSQISSK